MTALFYIAAAAVVLPILGAVADILAIRIGGVDPWEFC